MTFFFHKISNRILGFLFKLKVAFLENYYQQKINFVKQGEFELNIIGPRENFKIDKTSHLKSGAFVDCSGGVVIGKYFHTGRNLTIFSSNHNYNSSKIPYDETPILKTVVIDDFVWCGANVTILPGVNVGEGAVIGAGSVVTKSVQKNSVVAGNPAKIIGKRDSKLFYTNKIKKNYF